MRNQQASVRLAHFSWRAHPMVFAIMATIGAAGLVLYFQYRAIPRYVATQVIIHQIASSRG